MKSKEKNSLVGNKSVYFYEIQLEELKLIQSEVFLKSYQTDIQKFENYNFGLFNYRVEKINNEEIEMVDIVFCNVKRKIYKIENVFYSKFQSDPTWYYVDGISKQVRKIKFGKKYKQIELGMNIFVFRLKHQIIGGMYDLVSVFEDSNEIFHSDSQFGNNWFLKKHENGFQILSYLTNNVYNYPENLIQNSELNTFEKHKNKEEFVRINSDSGYNIYHNFFEDGYFFFFFALNESKVSKIIEKLSYDYERHIIVNEFINDPSRNILIKVPQDDISGIFFFSRIKIKKKLNSIEIFHTEIEDILTVSNRNCEIISIELCKKYNCSKNELRDKIVNKYGISNILVKNALFKPKQLQSEYYYLVSRIVFKYFASYFNFQSGDDFYNSEIYKKLRNDFQKSYSDISKMVSLSTFKNEYSLYKLFSFYFPDSIYQYKADWLSGLTIDIFIPSINIAVEFQGQQHYESTDYFHKDKDSFINQISRDAKKKKLVRDNGSNLIEWPYWRPINTVELNSLLIELGLDPIPYIINTNDNVILF